MAIPIGFDVPELGATETVVDTAMLSRSMIETVSSSVFVTTARPAREDKATPWGDVPTLSVPQVPKVLVLITETEFDPLFVTTATFLSRSRATPRGGVPTETASMTVKSVTLDCVL